MDPRLNDILSAAREESPALPFPTLVHRLRRRGAAVNERILRRTLDRADSGVRILDPWRGALAPLRRYLEDEASGLGVPPVDPEKASAAPGGSSREAHLWVLTGPDDADPPGPDAPALSRIRATLRYLGRHLDARSPGDVARWVSLVQEAQAFPTAA